MPGRWHRLRLGEQDADFALRQMILQRLLQHVANHATAFRTENIERVGRNVSVGAIL